MMSKLPKNWCECKLEDLGKIFGGYAFKSSNYTLDGARVVRITNVQKGHFEDETPKFYSIQNFLNDYLLQNDDILISLTGNVGRVCKIEQKYLPAYLNQRVEAFRINNKICAKFVYYLMQQQEFEKKCIENSKGVAQKNLSPEYIKKYVIFFPPLDEQKRIVEKIEELFSDIDNGIKDLKIAQAQIKQYRQSVLKSAFEGKLTDNWRQLHKCEKNMEIKEETGIYKIPHSWLWCKLTAIGTLNRGKSKHRPRNDKKLYGGKYPFIQTGDVKEANMYIHKYSQTYNDFGLSQSKLWNENTLCITIAANIAETAILKIKACFPDSIVGFVKNKYLYSEELVEYYFRTIKGKLEKYAPATAQKNINLSVLNDILFPLPSLPEQQQIVAEIEKRFAVADEMEKAVKDSLLQAEKLKQSILKQAFAGKLVPQNPNDEPAAVLLERIKAVKENSTKGKK